MFSFLHSLFSFTVVAALSLSAEASPLRLSNLPKEASKKGNAFIEAWLVFRADLDSLASLDVHPALFDHWFEAMPAFLVEDAAHLATEPAIVLAAKTQLAHLGRGTAPALITAQRHKLPQDIKAGMDALKRLFPFHYLVFARRELYAQSTYVENGMYDTWLRTIGNAVRRGARSSGDLVREVKAEMEIKPSTGDPETYGRMLAALIDFWQIVDIRIASTPKNPSWPRDYKEAMAAIDDSRGMPKNPAQRESRISAAIALCAVLGEELDYERISKITEPTTAFSPFSDRVVDGNFATTLHVKKGDVLMLLNSFESSIKGLWVSNVCPENNRSGIKKVNIIGFDGHNSWKENAILDTDTKYFQYIGLKNKTVSKIEIKIDEIQGEAPACIAEIRLDTQTNISWPKKQ